MKCPNCNHINPESNKFCAECGTKLLINPSMIECPNCQSQIPVDSKFCPDCGKEVKIKTSEPQKGEKETMLQKFTDYGSIQLEVTKVHDVLEQKYLYDKVLVSERGIVTVRHYQVEYYGSLESDIFDDICVTCYEDMPYEWMQQGFYWFNSYDLWLQILHDLEFSIEVREQPHIKQLDGYDHFYAELVATAKDKSIIFRLSFLNRGDSTSSSNTLYMIHAYSKSYPYEI